MAREHWPGQLDPLRGGLRSALNASSLLGGALAALSVFRLLSDILELKLEQTVQTLVLFYTSSVRAPIEFVANHWLHWQWPAWSSDVVVVWGLMALAAFRTLMAARGLTIRANRFVPRSVTEPRQVPLVPPSERPLLAAPLRLFLPAAIVVAVVAWPLLVLRFHYRRPMYLLADHPNAPLAVARALPNVFWGQILVMFVGVLILLLTNAGLGAV